MVPGSRGIDLRSTPGRQPRAVLSYQHRQAVKRVAWAALSFGSHARMTTLLDRQSPPPLYDAPHPRLRELLLARRTNTPSDDIDLEFRRGMSREFAGVVEDATLEPGGWVTVGRARVPEAVSMGHLPETRAGRLVYSTLPQLHPSITDELETGISLCDPLASNYVHFLDLILGRVGLAREMGIDAPLLVSDWVAELPFVRALGLPLRVIHGPVRVKRLYVIRAALDAKRNYEFTRSLLPTEPQGEDRLLLIRRAQSTGRGLTNQKEVETVCREFGFDPYDPGAEPLNTERFARARYIVSPHGAGLANMMFRAGGELAVLELFHEGIIRDHFFILARHYGFDYDCLVAPAPRPAMSHHELNTVPYAVDADALRGKLRAMLDRNGDSR